MQCIVRVMYGMAGQYLVNTLFDPFDEAPGLHPLDATEDGAHNLEFLSHGHNGEVRLVLQATHLQQEFVRAKLHLDVPLQLEVSSHTVGCADVAYEICSMAKTRQ